MLKKSYSKNGTSCRVTFKLTDVEAETAVVCGEFNNWNSTEHPMEKRKDGSFSVTVSIPANQSYRFRYLLDGEKWFNDTEADGLEPNQYGTEDCVLNLNQ